jgi:exodeoxyribonuclease V alpha subunit
MNMAIERPMSDAVAMIEVIESWVQRQWLREIDLALTRFLWQEAPDASPELLLAIVLTSHQLGRGHVCLDLKSILTDPNQFLALPPDPDSEEDPDAVIEPAHLLAGVSLPIWALKIRHPELVSDGAGKSPLVFDGERLYLRRFWIYERSVEVAIRARLLIRTEIDLTLPEQELSDSLSVLFPPEKPSESHSPSSPPEKRRLTDWQKVACALAARSAFSIITGGPGTGKTTTVVKLLALLNLIALNQQNSPPLRICLAAPTGKAAARLKEAIAGAIHRLPACVLEQPGLQKAIPTEVITLHRLLGTRPHSREFRHHARNPLSLDVLVVDEASMVDLEMMAALLSALPAHARLILLGDKDQLASVEAGSVLGELCRRAQQGHFTPATAHWINAVAGETIEAEFIDARGHALDQHIVMLRESHRFTAESGIGQLAAAVNAGSAERITKVLQSGYADLIKHYLQTLEDHKLENILVNGASIDIPEGSAKGYAHYLSILHHQRPLMSAAKSDFDEWARQILTAYSQFQVLCALRKGPFGVEGLNQRIVKILSKHELIRPASAWYEGRPVLVTKNDYPLGLMNGDIGITLPYPQVDKESGVLKWVMRVAFPKADGSGGIHWIMPSRLLNVETVFALTVHKSQGSEFEHCALLLPSKLNPVLTRELIYTGITRAKKWFSLISVGEPEMITDASMRTVQRSGGLFNST